MPFYGRPIIKTEFGDKNLVYVGREKFVFQGETFNDFLVHFLKCKIGHKWLQEQSELPDTDKHPLLLWFAEFGKVAKTAQVNEKGMFCVPGTGSMLSLLKLAYYLYLLGHNAKIEDLLLTRLRNKDQFYAALYETYVASIFIYAGFDLELEDETDSTQSHCEFTAINRKTGNKYSVEAKLRNSSATMDSVKITHNLIRALKKQANHPKIIFIDANYQLASKEEMHLLFDRLECQINTIEANPKQSDEAFLYITNNPYHFCAYSAREQSSVLIRGFRKPDFNLLFQAIPLQTIVDLREKYQDLLAIHGAFEKSMILPEHFHGDFVDQIYKILPIKNKYQINSEYSIPFNRKIMKVILDNYIIDVINKELYLMFKNNDGTIIHIETISDEDIANHQDAQQKMLDAIEEREKKPKDLLGFYDWLYKCYKNTDREKLIEWMKGAIDISILETKTQTELSKMLCIGYANSAFSRHTPNPNNQSS